MAIPRRAAESASKTFHAYTTIYPWKSKIELGSYLCKNIIHKSEGLIAVNKPYGVGLKTLTEAEKKKKRKALVNVLYTRGCEFSLEDVLPIMRDELKLPNLTVVKAAEKYNSGVTVLAETPKIADIIQKKIKAAKPLKKVIYNYYVVSLCTPYLGIDGQMHGEKIGIALQKNPAHNVSQPVVVRDYSHNSAKRGDVQTATVAFGIKSYGVEKTTLIEFCTNETRMNLIRVYFADMLMPILGDHLYGQRVGIVQGVGTRTNPLQTLPGASPQKIPPELVEILQLGTKKNNEDIPLHVHLHTMTIPHFYGEKKDLNLHAPVTNFFKWTCDALKLNIPKVETTETKDKA